MNRAIIFRPAARKEVITASAWYHNQRPGLGDDFEFELNSKLKEIVAYPEALRQDYRSVRHVSLGRFPYAMYFVVRPNALIVIAVLHHRRNAEEILKNRL